MVLGLFAAGVLAGCTSLRDARGPSEICEVHHTFMRSVQVPGPKKGSLLPTEYVAVGVRMFPHCLPDFEPDKRHQVVIYVCDECVRAQRQWKLQHPGVVP